MATSGQFYGTCNGTSGSKYNLWVTWSVDSQSPIYNTSNITVSMRLQRNDGYSNSAYNLTPTNPVKLYVGGALKVDTTIAIDTRNSAVVTLATWTGAVSHNSDGTLNLSISGEFTLNGLSTLTGGSVSGTAAIDSLDRVAPTVSISVSNIGTDRFSLSASANASCNLWEYSLNGGSTYTTFYGAASTQVSTTITGLSPATAYSVKVRARKSSNYIYGYSSTTPITTLGKSTLNSISDFAADAANPNINTNITCANASFTHNLDVLDGSTIIISYSGFTLSAGTNNKSFSVSTGQRTTLLQYMTAKKSLTATFRLRTYNGGTLIGESTATANITTSEDLSRPTFGTPTYSDTNNLTVAVTGSNQILIQGLSQLLVVCPTATAKNEATIKSYSVSIGDKTVTGSNTMLNLGTINASGDLTLTATATDSRGYFQSNSIPVKVLPYTRPAISEASVRRKDSVGETIILSFAGSVCSILTGGTEKNRVKDIAYRYKKTSDSDFGASVSIKTGATINGLEYSYSNSAAFTLDPEYSYDLQIIVSDALTSHTKDLIVPRGTPEISIRKGKVGVCNANPTAPLDVGGAIKAGGFYNGFVRMLSDDDADELRDGGIYGYIVVPGEYNDSANLPTTVPGILEVIPAGTTSDGLYVVIQRFTSWEGTIYQRTYFTVGGWGEWTVVATREGDISNELYQHTSNKNNPHQVTKGQIGLGNVDNTSDMDKPVSAAQQAAINAVKYTHPIGDGNGHVPAVGTTNIGKFLKGTSAATAGWASLSSSDISDLTAAIASHSDVSANTDARHTHVNKSVLDATTAAFTTEEKEKLAEVEPYRQHRQNTDSHTDQGEFSILTVDHGEPISGVRLADYSAEGESALALEAYNEPGYAHLFCRNIYSNADIFADNLHVSGAINGTVSNAATADKLKTSRNISLSGDVSGSASFDGGSNITINTQVASTILPPLGATRANLGNPSLFEVAAFQEEFNNKTAFFDPANISYQTSSDGVNWTEYTVSADITRSLFGGDDGGTLNIPNGTTYFRIKLRAPTSFYVYLNALYMYCSTSGHSCKVHIYKKHDSGSYTQHTSSDVNASTWPGHVYVPFSTIPWNANATLGTHFHEVYIVLIPTWNPTYPTNNILLYKVQLWGGYPAGSRNVWKVDRDKNVIFPSYIKVGNSNNTDSATCYYFEKNNDGYLRKKPLANVRAEIVNAAAVGAALGYTPRRGTLGSLTSPTHDFNNCLTEGDYNIAGANITNAPYTGNIYGKLRVYVNDGGTHNNTNNWIWQYFDDTSSRLYYRRKVNSAPWTAWQEITPSQYATTNHTHSNYAPKASPTFTGTPTAPTATKGTNTTQIATTAFVQEALNDITISGFPYLGELSLTAAGDFNDLKTTGWWYWGWNSISQPIWAHEPEPMSSAVDNYRRGILKVYAPNSSYAVQEFHAISDGTIYTRTYNTYSGWSPWSCIKHDIATFSYSHDSSTAVPVNLALKDHVIYFEYMGFGGDYNVDLLALPNGGYRTSRELTLLLTSGSGYVNITNSTGKTLITPGVNLSNIPVSSTSVMKIKFHPYNYSSTTFIMELVRG